MLPTEINLRAQCLCGTYTFETRIQTSTLPLQASLCHCDSCRHGTGALYSSNMPWPGSANEIFASCSPPLSEYAFSKNTTILFCARCSSPMFCREGLAQEAKWEVFTGVISNNATCNLIQIKDHIFVGDTKDGGAAVWLRNLKRNSLPVPCYTGWRYTSVIIDPRHMTGTETNSETDIPIECHCRGVSLVLRGAASIQHPNKLRAWFDACEASRHFTGTDIMNWVVVPVQRIESVQKVATPSFPTTTGDLKSYVHASSTLACYSTQDNDEYYFCSKCSASVFLVHATQQETFNLAAGLIGSSTARAMGTLSWDLGHIYGMPSIANQGWRDELIGLAQKDMADWSQTL